MSSETFATAIFLITAIVAAAVLVNAFFPVIYQATSTFSDSSQSADERMRTEIKIINTFGVNPTAKIWIKNIGSARVAKSNLDMSDVFFGEEGDYDILIFNSDGTPADGEWSYSVIETTENNYWDQRETLEIEINSASIPAGEGNYLYFQLALPNGVTVSRTYTTSG
ncbi:flagellin [Methanoplanus endosymbiosus]|uniref:Flagellin n=1 Tax=Methanoplanus endosymbiosus TaxID=33865 RepID=A0A9E7PKM4_9EURY|nr:flagellin [Methanoplanus endosymbiosus]UUX91818.1 flagellin [Methanoplanus endosymbiosus]